MAYISDDAAAIAAAGLVQAFVASRNYVEPRVPTIPDLLELHREFAAGLNSVNAVFDPPPPID